MTLTKTEKTAFDAVGEDLCSAKECAANKKLNMPLIAGAIAENHAAFIEGITIGNHHFKLVVREELTAIRV